MEHVVFFSVQNGEPEFRRAPDLDEAVRLVEQLRNERGVDNASVHALTPVQLTIRAYYHVQVDALPAAPAEPVAPADAPGQAEQADQSDDAGQPAVPPAREEHEGVRSLGYFAH